MKSDCRKQVELLLEEAYHHYKENDLEKTNEIYDFLIEKLSQKEQGLKKQYLKHITLLKGQVQMNIGNYDKALSLFNSIIDQEPLNISAILKRGILCMKLKLYDKSWQDLKKCLLFDPDSQHIQNSIQLLNQRLSYLQQTDKTKYLLKQQIAEMIKFPQVQQDMLLNFSQLRLIDKHSVCSSKSVSIVKEPTATIQIEQECQDIEFYLNKLVKEVVMSKDEIKEIENMIEMELEPKRLEQELNSQMRRFSPVKVFYDKGETPEETQSILRHSRNQPILHPSNRPTSSFSQTTLKYRRVSAMQVKNIDGKIINNNQSMRGQKGSSSQSSPDIEFIGIQNIQSLGKKQIPTYKTHNIKRKSSIKKGKSITTRPNQITKFSRQGHIDLFSVNIDKPLHHENINKDLERVHYKHSESSQISRVVINDEPQDIEEVSQFRKSSGNKKEEEVVSPYLGLGLKRKESILKAKRKFQGRCENINTENQ